MSTPQPITLTVPASIEYPASTVHGLFGDSSVPASTTSVTVVLSIDATAAATIASLLPAPAPGSPLSAQDLANQYSSAELIAAYQLAIKAGK